MQKITEEIKRRVTEYFNGIPEMRGTPVPDVLIDFVIEKYAACRQYPQSFSEERKQDDMKAHISVLVMAVIDLLAKQGAEGETSHSEPEVSRTYENAYISSSVFNNVFPYVNVF